MVDAQAEQFETVLAEALRAGPASPAWKQAVELLQAQGHSGDEWSLLIRARERLECGREYRSIRPGSEFTQRLMKRIDQTPQSSSGGLPVASLVMAGAALAILAVVGILTWLLLSPSQDAEGRIDLRNTLFVSTLLSQDFDETIPAGWTKIGSLKLSDKNGARIATTQSSGDDYAGGGLLLPVSLGPREPFSLETSLELINRPGGAAAQIFVSESETFSPDRGTSPRELVVHLEQKGARVVLPDGQTAASSGNTIRGKTRLRVLISRDRCLIEQDGRTLFSGEHQLAQDKPRYLGIRMMGKGAIQRDAITVHSVVVRKP